MTELVLAERFNGPPGSGNGGYVCGTLAALVGEGPVQVRLHRPSPLGRSLTWEGGRLLDGEALVAEAAAWTGDVADVPAPVAPDVAADAAARFPGHTRHPFPSCFGCGTDRAPGDGLRIFAGPVPGTGLLAAPWRPDASLAERGCVPTAIVWTALDCPGGWAVMNSSTVVLGTMIGHVIRPVNVGEDLVVTGWPVGVEGRKRYAGSALHTPLGELVAWSTQIWLTVG